MSTTASDISVVLSGGTINISPNDSLGGDPSSTPFTTNTVNNMFDDISPEQSRDGYEDYRCLYIFNDGELPIYSAKIWVEEEFSDGASVLLGLDLKDEIQRITISGSVSGGSLTLSYGDESFVSSYNASLAAWATALEDSLNALESDDESLLSGVTVTAQNISGGGVAFDVRFLELDGRRNHDTILLVANNLTPSTSATITTIQHGSPINTVAVEIDLETTPPGGVTFVDTSEESPLELPKLLPEDGFPIWIKRVVEAGATAKANDGFRLQFSAESLAP